MKHVSCAPNALLLFISVHAEIVLVRVADAATRWRQQTIQNVYNDSEAEDYHRCYVDCPNGHDEIHTIRCTRIQYNQQSNEQHRRVNAHDAPIFMHGCIQGSIYVFAFLIAFLYSPSRFCIHRRVQYSTLMRMNECVNPGVVQSHDDERQTQQRRHENEKRVSFD